MRLLYSPQISMRSYADSGWLLSSDAQLTKMRAYIEQLPRDWKWFMLMPDSELVPDTYVDLCNERRVVPLPVTWPSNVLQHRFHFNINEMRVVLREVRPDVILCEIPEHVRSWRCAMKYEGVSCPIVAMFEHVDIYDETKVDTSFMLRQIEGFLEADLNVFPLEGMRDEWWKSARRVTGWNEGPFSDDTFHPDLDHRYPHVWNGIWSPDEVLDSTSRTGTREERPTIFFISRCSDDQRTRYTAFARACEILHRRNVDAQVWYANPNEAGDWEVLEKNPLFVDHDYGPRTLSRDQYLELLWRADVVPVLYPMSHIYSVGFLEAITASNVVVTARPLEGHTTQTTGVIIDVDTAEKIADGLQAALEISTREPARTLQHHRQMDWAVRERSIPANIVPVLGDLASLTARAEV